MLRYFAAGVLLTPIALILLGLIFTYLPGVANFISNIFWGLLGETKLFSLASAVLQNGLSFKYFDWNQYWNGFVALLLGAMSEAVIMAVCVFAVKAFFVAFNTKWEARFTRPEWGLTLVGVIIGVVICGIKAKLAMAAQGLMTAMVTLVLYIWAILLMLRGGSLKNHPTYRNRRAGFIIKMLLGIVGNMFDAFCGVFIITALLEGPRLMRMGGSVVAWIAWIGLTVALLYLKNLVMKMLQPETV